MVILLSFVNAACCMACNGSEKNYWSLNFKWWKWEWVSWETNDLLFVWLSIKVECSIFCLDGSTCVYDSPCFICNISLTPFLLIPYATLLLLPSTASFLLYILPRIECCCLGNININYVVHHTNVAVFWSMLFFLIIYNYTLDFNSLG